MNPYLLMTAAIFTYGFKASMFYSSTAKQSHFYYVIGALLSVIISVLWLRVTHDTIDANKVFFYSNVFNLMGMCVDLFLPYLVFGLHYSKYGIIGIIFVTLGTILVKMN